METQVFEEFISEEDADTLIRFMTEHRDQLHAKDSMHFYLNDEVPWLLEFIDKYGDKFKELVQPQVPVDMSDYIYNVYTTGASMAPHVDNTPSFGHCHFTGVIYLNDAYEGGELYFPGTDVSIKAPARGAVVFGNVLHGVSTVTSGERYILGIGFTDDPDYFRGGKLRKHLL